MLGWQEGEARMPPMQCSQRHGKPSWWGGLTQPGGGEMPSQPNGQRRCTRCSSHTLLASHHNHRQKPAKRQQASSDQRCAPKRWPAIDCKLPWLTLITKCNHCCYRSTKKGSAARRAAPLCSARALPHNRRASLLTFSVHRRVLCGSGSLSGARRPWTQRGRTTQRTRPLRTQTAVVLLPVHLRGTVGSLTLSGIIALARLTRLTTCRQSPTGSTHERKPFGKHPPPSPATAACTAHAPELPSTPLWRHPPPVSWRRHWRHPPPPATHTCTDRVRQGLIRHHWRHRK